MLRLPALVILVAVVASGAWGQDAASAPGFTDITRESGVAEIVARQHEAVAKVLAAKGDPEYQTWWLSGVALIDLSGNGNLNLFIEGHGQPAAAAYNDGKGHFTAVDAKPDIPRGTGKKNDIPFPGGEIRAAIDLDEDGKVDLLASYGDNRGVPYLNDCKPGRPPVWNFRPCDPGLEAFSRSIAFVDLNRDGYLDYLMTGDEGRSRATHPMHVYWGKGQGKWELAPLDIQVLKEAAAIACDIDGDGLDELLSSQCGYNPARRWVLHNDASPTAPPAGGKLNFRNVTDQCGLSEDGAILGVGDLNQDGFPDLVCLDVTDGKKLSIEFYFNDGKGHFTRRTEIESRKGPPPTMPTSCNAQIVDLDNDGIPDVIVQGKGMLWFLRGLGDGKFEQVNDRWGLTGPEGYRLASHGKCCFGDINGDGALDLVTAGPGPKPGLEGVAVWRNDLPRRQWLNVQLVGKPGNRAAAGAIIRLAEPGTGKLLAREEVILWGRQSFHNYYAAANTERHFGLGDRATVDVSVRFPGGKTVEKKDLKTGRTLVVDEARGTVE